MEIDLTEGMIRDLEYYYQSQIVRYRQKKQKTPLDKAKLIEFHDKFGELSKEMQRLKIKGKPWFQRKVRHTYKEE